MSQNQLLATNVIFRGTTVFFTTTFFDVNGNVTQPSSATVNLVYPNATPGAGGTLTISLPMTGPTNPAVTWTAAWDSRGAGVGSVAWSIHSDTGPPFAVDDGSFTLSANAANLVTFT